MGKILKDKVKMKRQYESPSLIQLGGIGVKTLGAMYYGYDNDNVSTCMDNGSPSPVQDPCNQEYYGS